MLCTKHVTYVQLEQAIDENEVPDYSSASEIFRLGMRGSHLPLQRASLIIDLPLSFIMNII